MSANEISSEKLYFDWYPLTEILGKTGMAIPDDFMKVTWIVISDTNTVIFKDTAELE